MFPVLNLEFLKVSVLAILEEVDDEKVCLFTTVAHFN